ncbi:hypothetical protein L1049_015546 [Liquidambar formosana]|uniref:Uncharacterized protein n=1 Tax=Liquidambar formosana TaxID=63359 RepID=A0AAP0S520_LIQFO
MKLIKMARKWQKVAAIRRKTISFPGTNGNVNIESGNMLLVADKGHFVIYTADQKRFEFPMVHLNN